METNMGYTELEQMLLYNKALAETEDEMDKSNRYLGILRQTGGEKLANPVDEAIRSVFSLVLDNGMDPWKVDLREFAKLYSSKAIESPVDMIIAGKLLYSAWIILNKQTKEVCDRFAEPEYYAEDDFYEEPVFDATPALDVPDATLFKGVYRDNFRPVTVFDLVEAFDDAREIAETQMERERVRKILREQQKIQEKSRKFNNKAHEEDDSKDVQRVWETIEKMGAGDINLFDLYTGSAMNDLRVFISVLQLVRDGKLDIKQDEPLGDVFISISLPEVSIVLEDRVTEA